MNINTSFGAGLSSINRATEGLNTSFDRISSGKRINSASDDAAGLSIVNRMSSEIRGFAQSTRNANDGISFLQTTSAGLSSLTDGIQRIRELALQASNGILSDDDRNIINAEAQQIKSELSRTIDSAQFNGRPLFNSDDSISIQVGDKAEDGVDISTSNFEQLMSDAGLDNLDLSTAAGAYAAIDSVDQLQSDINTSNANVGAGLNRLSSTIESLGARDLAAQASRSRIEDADMAKEISEMTSNKIKLEVAIAMQAQANAQKSSVLKLLEGL